MKSTMGYPSNKNCAKPSHFPSNSVCQHNQNSKMCQHYPEHIRICLLLPDYDAPLTHIQSTVLISYHAIAKADRNLPSVVLYPPKINRKNYCTVQYLLPKTTRAKNDASQRTARIRESFSSVCPCHFQHFDQKRTMCMHAHASNHLNSCVILTASDCVYGADGEHAQCNRYVLYVTLCN